MSDTCHCTITCATHAAAETIMAAAVHISTTLRSCREEFDRVLTDITTPWESPPITREDAIGMLRRFEQDLDHYGELTPAALQEFRRLMSTLNGEPIEPPVERPF